MAFLAGQQAVCVTSTNRYFVLDVTAVSETEVCAGGKYFDPATGVEAGNGKTTLLEATDANLTLATSSGDADLTRDLILQLASLEGTDAQFAAITRRLQLAIAAFEAA